MTENNATISINEDIRWMQLALDLAKKAEEQGEVPVGAVVVRDDQLLGGGQNSPITLNDPSAHAEILALREASSRTQNYRLVGTTLYVTLEPCIMCMGAIIQARVKRLVFGATDPKSGAVISKYQIGSDGFLNHRIEIESGVCDKVCSTLLTNFFKEKRRNRRS